MENSSEDDTIYVITEYNYGDCYVKGYFTNEQQAEKFISTVVELQNLSFIDDELVYTVSVAKPLPVND